MLKIIVSLLAVTFASILIFAFIYQQYQKKDFTHALYTSAMIQTLVGIQTEPTNNVEKIAMTVQSIISYLITAHIIFSAHQYIKKI